MKISDLDPTLNLAALDDHAFDALFAELPRPTPPAHLQQALLQRIQADLRVPPEISPTRSFWRPAATWGIGAAMATVLGLTLIPDTPEVGDSSQFLERGIPNQPTQRIRLEAAIQGGGRLVPNQPYPAGTVLIFRVHAQEPASYTLSRNGKVLGTGNLTAGENLLDIGYALEAGEESAAFTLESGGVSTTLYVAPVQP